tara:strand:- start:166 stop:636 length:471 start_codon:yes stop_codon:yes gene_type:complete
MSKNFFIFDLDETLYKFDDQYQIKDTINKKILEDIAKHGDIILFSNATYSHCLYWLQILDIKKFFSNIFSSDILENIKPNPLSYKQIVDLCGIKSIDNIYFFDDVPINLFSSYQEYKWNTYLINKNNNIEKNKSIWLKGQYNNINSCLVDILTKTT